MYRSAMSLVLIIGLAGCGTSQQSLDGQGASLSTSSSGNSSDSATRENCELKNPTGTGPCEDGRSFKPSDCTTRGLAAYPLLAELGHRMSDWKDYCSEQEAVADDDLPSSPAQSVASRTMSDDGDGDTGGTWYCDTLDGSGMYGIYGMRDLPNIDASTCKKVSD